MQNILTNHLSVTGRLVLAVTLSHVLTGLCSAQSNLTSSDVDTETSAHRVAPVADLPVVSIGYGLGTEGGGATTIPVTLSKPSTDVVTVFVHTRAGTATQGLDYWGFTKRLSFAPGETFLLFEAIILDDNEVEGDINTKESFDVRLFDANGANIGQQVGSVEIFDNDNPDISIRILDSTGIERNGVVWIYVSLSDYTRREVKVRFNTTPGTALPGIDYKGRTQTITIPPLSNSASGAVVLLRDDEDEEPETFGVRLFDSDGLTISRQQATITVLEE